MLLPAILFATVALAVPQEATPAPAPAAQPAAAPAPASAQPSIDAGLAAFRKGRFKAARDAFQKALDADPQSAAANFYLGYALYKIAEPTKRLTPDKQRALDLFTKCYEIDPAFRPAFKR